MHSNKRALLKSGLALLLCVSMLVSTTFAWFTDVVESGKNIIAAGNLDVELYHSNAAVTDERVKANTELFLDLQGNPILWEPGVVSYENLRVANEGSLALVYQLAINVAGENYILDNGAQYGLSQVLKVGVVKGGITATDRDGVVSSVAASDWMALSTFVREGALKADADETWGIVIYWQPGPNDNNWNANNGKQLSSGDKLSIELGIHLTATQMSHEKDSFGNDYDVTAKDDIFPSFGGGTASTPVNVAGGYTTEAVTIAIGDITATVPAGVKVTDGTTGLTLTIKNLPSSSANIVLGEDEALRSLDVHIDGVAEDNTTPITVTLPEVAPVALNMGNYNVYHVENGATNEMTLVGANVDFDAHNQFKYDPANGDVVLYMATFSEVAMTAEDAEWEGNFNYDWYDADAEELIIANADQLAAFGAIVGGMAKDIEQDSFAGKTVKLIADINLGDKESENNPNLIFYPIGYNSSDRKYEKTGVAVTTGFYNFCGTFDGNGHTIANFYHNTWEMKGDNNYYDATLQYYRDGMGLFGRVYKGAVKNLTVKNFSSDGEYTTTGVIAAYADGATFENIAVFNCNPRVYNIGNGGIVGCVGWYAKDANLKTTFKNITVDNSNKISALWGSYDVPCGGIVGQYYPTSGQTSANKPANGGISFENCHISAIMDVNNDVCGNYQYYAYRYAGMLIGSVSENVTIDGHVYPKMDGITAKDCTVHFGTWNDYYYCEFEKNGHPSYSGPDDYKFSRIPHSEINFTDTDGNGVINNEVERESVKGCKHNHTAAEDQRCVYLQFNNLVTGNGWGVTTKMVGDLEGVTILDREYANSVDKFEGIANGKEYQSGSTITIGELFEALADAAVDIKGDKVNVTISPVIGSGSTASATYIANTSDWTQGTLTFSGMGMATITIQDYYFCKPTTITVEIAGQTKFQTKFTGDFLYRVGNASGSTVALGTLFEEIVTATDATTNVDFMTLAGNAFGKFTANTSDWTKGTIQFSGTGVVKVTITDNDACIPTELLLEVIDATNLTSATGTTTGGTFVLLCDVNTTTYVNYWNSTLYGNGFEYTLKGAPTAYNSKQGKGIIITKNTVLDNVRIIGDVYTGYGAFTENNYYNTAIDVTGDTTIQNCYIANCAAPIRARNNVNIINTTLHGGAVGNLIIESGTVTLEDVTTANYDDGRALVGMGIVIHSDATEAAKLVLNGTLTQYNFISESKVPTDTYAKNLHNAMFSNDCSQYQFGTSPNRYVNTGIISLEETFNGEDITDNANTGYVGKTVTIQGNKGYVYTQLNTSGSVNNNCPKYKPTTQGAVPPSYSFDYTNKNYVAKTDGSNDYCYEDSGKVNISMDEGDTFNWDTSILTIGKGITNYTVSMNGTDYTGKSIAFNTAGDYEVKYTYTDANNYKLDGNGNITTYHATYTKTVSIAVAVVKPTTKNADFKFGSNTATEKITIGNKTYVSAVGVSESASWTYMTIDGQKIYYPIVEAKLTSTKGSSSYAYFPVFENVVTITDYVNGDPNNAIVYNSSTTQLPNNLTAVKGYYKEKSQVTWTSLTESSLDKEGATKIFKWASGSDAPSTPTTYKNVLCYKSPSIEANRNEYITLVQYSYKDGANVTHYYFVGYTLAKFTCQQCITPDTLITLADGSQVRVDSLKGDEQLLVWNHETGKLDKAPVAYIVNHDAVVAEREVYHLTFANGKTVKIIGEHVFFDATLNKYVALDSTAADYIGHEFLGLADNGVEKVKLVSVEKKVYETSAYEVVSYKHLTCFTNDMLSTSAYLDQLLNVFDINTDTFAYDMESVVRDIETYGLYTYADFEGLISEEAFELYDAQYLKIAIGKGYITWDDIHALIDIYFNVEVEPLN